MATEKENHVDILCVIDAESLFGLYPGRSHEHPKKFVRGSEEIKKYCRMITRSKNAFTKEPVGTELMVHATVGDVVRWRATSLTSDTEYKVRDLEFYDFQHDICDQPVRIDTDIPGEEVWKTRITKAGGPDYYWLKFRIVAPSGEDGWFDWDPGIKATE